MQSVKCHKNGTICKAHNHQILMANMNMKAHYDNSKVNISQTFNLTLRPDFTSKLVHILAFGTPKFYIAPYDKINH